MASRRAVRRRSVVKRALTYVAVVIVCVIFLFPIFWLIATALKTRAQAFSFPPLMEPHLQELPRRLH